MLPWLWLLAALLSFGSNYALRLATTVCMYAVMAQSWNFIGGLAGYPSFATAAFFGFGAYASAILQNHGRADARRVAARRACSAAVRRIHRRRDPALSRHYFAIASLIVAEMLREIVNSMPIVRPAAA